MKNKTFLALIFCLCVGYAEAQQPNKAQLDLIDVQDDKINVKFIPTAVDEDEVEFQIPKIVPGTYSISDFGRFVSDFKAYDQNDSLLNVSKISVNRWSIKGARNLKYITYKVDDTFDSDLDNAIFEPGGTNIEADKEVFVLNTFGFIGYIKGYDKIPYEVTVKHPENLYGATSMIGQKVDANTDVYKIGNYFDLADAPMMYAEPDTATTVVGGAEILVSVYSPNNRLTSAEVMNNVEAILEGQKNYLGGELPIEKYAFLIYLFAGQTKSGAYGALEHSYSSLYVLPEAGIDRLGQTINDVAAHEFFHIVTPLNIHSEQIGDFDFIEPEMSEHLWLYEGVTEYSSHHMQVKYDFYDTEEFLEVMRRKIFSSARSYDRDMSFTEMSANVLKPEYEPQYGNVYEKGALIGMCLDLVLINESKGKYDLQQLMKDLAKEFGKDKSFKDSELFDKIESLTYPAARKFLDQYVRGNERLPLKEVLAYAGIDYDEEKIVKTATGGGIGLNVNSEREVIVSDASDLNEFGKDMGYQKDDVLLSLNGREITLNTAQDIFNDFAQNTKEGDKVIMVVRREVKGKMKKKKLKAKAVLQESKQPFVISLNESPTPEQLLVRNAWLKP
ncbi:MAG: peptidase M61 [Bacteroidota bacterium]